MHGNSKFFLVILLFITSAVARSQDFISMGDAVFGAASAMQMNSAIHCQTSDCLTAQEPGDYISQLPRPSVDGLIYQFMFLHAAHTAAQKANDKATLQHLAQATQKNLIDSGIDLTKFNLNEKTGFEPKKTN